MKIPAYWARRNFTFMASDGSPLTRSALGWSFSSQAEADQLAAERAQRFAQAQERGEFVDEYYSVIPIREPLLETITVDEEDVGLVTRNRYGCRVLNTDRVFFADIDDVNPPWFRPAGRTGGLLARIGSLFRPKAPPSAPAGDNVAMQQIARWHAQTGIAARVYRTFAGHRLMIVDRQCSPLDPETADILRTLKSDPLYVQLTRRQECFRARLSPKPWRIGVKTPGHPSPINHPNYADQLAQWAVSYEARAAQFATCRLVQMFGEPAEDSVITAVVRMHDHYCLRGDLPLA